MQRQNAKLLEHCGRMEKQKAVVMGQVAEMQENWAHAASESTRLHSEIATLRQTLEVCTQLSGARRTLHVTACSKRVSAEISLCVAGQHALHGEDWFCFQGPGRCTPADCAVASVRIPLMLMEHLICHDMHAYS
jgi:regulator of replication initiation timing